MKPLSLNLKMMKSVAMIISHRPIQKLNRTLLKYYHRYSKHIQETGKNSPSCRPGVVVGQSPAANRKSCTWLDGLAARLDIASLHAIGIGRTPPETPAFAKPTIAS